MSVSASKKTASSSKTASKPVAGGPDAVVKGTGDSFSCSIDDEALSSLRQRAARLIWKAGEKAYGHFPIDRVKLYQDILGRVITEKNVCRTLVEPRITEADHNELRKRYMSNRLSKKNGAALGLVGTSIPLKAQCTEEYDWRNSPYFAEADSCKDVTEEFTGHGIPTAIYSTDLSATEASVFLMAPDTSPLYTRYAGEGPTACTWDPVGGAFFHRIHVWGTINAEFAMKTSGGPGWSAWTLVNKCTTPDGKTHSSTDLMFDVGIRIFVQMEVEIDGQRAEKTLVLSQVAAASEGVLAKLVPKKIPLERFFGGEYAKKLLMESKARGWRIEKK